MGFCSIDEDFSKDLQTKKQKKPVQKQEKVEKEISYESKSIMTASEKTFYKKLIQAVPKGYTVQFQIPLSAIVKKISDYRYANELYRTIDFGLMNQNTLEIELLIELNDKTHLEGKRQYRDIKVKEICAQAKIPLITFWTNYDNEVDYMRKRIKKFLEEKTILAK